jgi:hypothetical protein
MSEHSLRQILVDAEAEIPALKTEEERWAHVLRFFGTNARDLAEFSYLGASGKGDDVLKMAHDSNLLKLMDAIEETLTAFDLDDADVIAEAFKTTGDAFHGRFMELANVNQGEAA